MWKSFALSRFALVILLALIVITQGVVVHAGQGMMQDERWAQFSSMFSADFLKHCP